MTLSMFNVEIMFKQCLKNGTNRFDINHKANAVLQQHVLSNTRHSLLHQHQVWPDISNPLNIVLQKLMLL